MQEWFYCTLIAYTTWLIWSNAWLLHGPAFSSKSLTRWSISGVDGRASVWELMGDTDHFTESFLVNTSDIIVHWVHFGTVRGHRAEALNCGYIVLCYIFPLLYRFVRFAICEKICLSMSVCLLVLPSVMSLAILYLYYLLIFVLISATSSDEHMLFW